ncbi:protein of unknown function [Taphrina deformans PYCC 5710]|uniref:Post-GPI attachment to proteins factor 3 n=1 Tax=Taphrina deformans (strain PYCC 5710 / ATCC 11124 / CBS 356.35 / IMI 108563 / JCM 9778 / NBRC 8474) TaxID=1097556 RepID=R4XIA5_TAPDE|nr:protein of unknown function [Taphrina deformans PYCC 5710]|eukprot:CCG84234.1 protein of unknown function [Taphrina deformans PYCC 5710]
MKFFHIIGSLLAAIFFGSVQASRGDQLSIFRDCVKEQISETCATDGISFKDGQRVPMHLRLLRWTCASDADYSCQQAVTQYLVENNEQIEQFHGKWPFVRVMGVQEPASVIFSILNGWVHYEGLSLVKQQLSLRNPMRNYYIFFAYIGMNAWLWSTIFHVRDLPSTEKMDYFSAGTYVLFGLFYAPIRVFKVYNNERYGIIVKIWGTICASALFLHISYLTFITFDYGYNMLANVVVGSLHGLMWLVYSAIYTKSRPPWAYWPVLTVLALAGAMSLELFDFPPWLYAIDAHSLWHLATIPITWFWYRFLLEDAAWEQKSASNNVKNA